MRVKLEKGGQVPHRETAGAAAYDMFYNGEEEFIFPGNHMKLSLGVYMEIPRGMCGILTHRSGMNSKQGVWAYGTIDDDYRGLVSITLFNLDPNQPVRIQHGDRIGQLRFVHKVNLEMEVTDGGLTETKRGTGGHGSTGA